MRTGEKSELAVWRTLFVARLAVTLVIVALVASPLSGANGPRWTALVAGVSLYHGFLHFWAKYRSRTPCLALILGDHAVAIGVVWLEPAAIAASAIAAVAAIAMAATIDLRRTYWGTAAMAPLYIASCIVRETGAAATIVPAYAGAAFTLPYVIGRLGEGQRRTRDRYRSLLEGIDALVWESKPSRLHGHTVAGSADPLFGFAATEWQQPRHWIDHVHLDDRERVLRELAAGVASGSRFEISYRMIGPDRRIVDVRDRIMCERDNLGVVRLLRGVMLDVSDQLALERRTGRLATMVEQLPVGVMIAKRDLATDELVVLESNSAANELLASAGDITGSALASVLGAYEHLARSIGSALDSGEVLRVDATAHDSGETLSLHAFGMSHDTVGVVIEDVTDQAVAAAALRHQAMHDSLTGLANRMQLMDAIRRSIDDATLAAILLVDLDGFKEINDTYGHDHGDQLLVSLAARLRRRIREGDLIARLGGDEFAIILQAPPGAPAPRTHAQLVAEKVLACTTEPFELDGREVRCGASIGIARFPTDGDSPHQLLKSADLSMYAAKRDGGGIADRGRRADRDEAAPPV